MDLHGIDIDRYNLEYFLNRLFKQGVIIIGATLFHQDTSLMLAKSFLNPDNIAPALFFNRVKRSPDLKEYNNENLGINIKLQNYSTGHIADITVNDLAKLHLPCIHGKVLKLNVEFNQDENDFTIKIKFHFPESKANLTGVFKLKHTKITKTSCTFEIDVQRSKETGRTKSEFDEKFFIKAKMDPGVTFTLVMEDQNDNTMLDILINFQCLETKFKVDESMYKLLPFGYDLPSSELTLEEHNDSIEISFSHGIFTCEIEYLKKSTNIMRISVYRYVEILLDLRLKVIKKKQDQENEFEVFYQIGRYIHESEGKIRVQFSSDIKRYTHNPSVRYYDLTEPEFEVIGRFINIMIHPRDLEWKEYYRFEMYLEERTSGFILYNPRENNWIVRMKGSVIGVELFSLQTKMSKIIGDPWEASLNTIVSFNASVIPYVPRYFRYFSEGNLTAKFQKDSAYVYISKNRFPVFNLDLSKQENLYNFKLSDVNLNVQRPYSIPSNIWFALFGLDFSEFSLELDNSGEDTRISGVRLTNRIQRLDLVIRRNLENSKLTVSHKNYVCIIQAELKEKDNSTSQLVVKIDGEPKNFNYRLTENGNPISLLRFVANTVSFHGNNYSLNVWHLFSNYDFHKNYSYLANINIGRNLEVSLDNTFVYNNTYEGEKTYEEIHQSHLISINPSSRHFRTFYRQQIFSPDGLTEEKLYDLDFGMTTPNLYKLYFNAIIDLEVEIGGLNYVSLRSKIVDMYELSIINVGEVAYMNLNGKDLFSYKVDTENNEIIIDFPISLMVMRNPISWYRSYKTDQPMLTTVVYSNNATMFGIYGKVKDSCFNGVNTPALELSRNHEIGFNKETLQSDFWNRVTHLYSCLGDEYIWKLVEIGADALGLQDNEIYEGDNMDYGSGDFGSGNYGSGYY